jgi:hypothetical protein
MAMHSGFWMKCISAVFSFLIIGLLLGAGLATETPARPPQENQVVSSFQKYIADFMASYQTDKRERVSKLGGGWAKEIYHPVGEPSLDIKKTDSLISPYVGICEFTLRREVTAFHKTKEEAFKDNTFVQSVDAHHRHRYAFQSGKWVPKVREYGSPGEDKWYDCNEVVSFGENAGEQNLFGCWEKN